MCEYCKKEFYVKYSYERHVLTCKNKIKNELNNTSITLESLQNELNLYKNKLEKIQQIVEDKDKHIQTLQNELNEFYIHSSYAIKFQQTLNMLVPYSTKHIKNKFQTVNIENLIYHDNFDIDKNFISIISDIFKDSVFCTDKSRGSIIIKNEKGENSKLSSELFILRTIHDYKNEYNDIIKNCLHLVRGREHDFTDEDYGKCMVKLAYISDSIKAKKSNLLIVMMSNKLIKLCPQMLK